MATKKKIQTGYSNVEDAAFPPPSKRFGGSEEADEAFNSRPIMDCHVGGVLVRDMPLLTQRLIHWDQTDEGFAAKNAGKVEPIGMTDALDKTLRQRHDDLRSGKDPSIAMQPLRFLDKYKKPGMSQKLLSTKKGELDPDYEVVKKPNGDPLKYKGMIVGERPTEDVQARNAFWQAHGKKKLDQLTAKHREEGGIVPGER